MTDVGSDCKTGLRLEEYEEIASATNGLIFPAGKFDIPKVSIGYSIEDFGYELKIKSSVILLSSLK